VPAAKFSVHTFLQRHRFLLMFATLSTLMGTSVGIARVTNSLYAIELHASESMLGLIAAGQAAGVLLVSLPVGVLVDRYGPQRPFLMGSILAGTTYALLPLVPQVWFLLLATTAIGFFMPMRFVSLSTVFMRELERIGVGKAGWYRGTHLIGMMLVGPVVAVSTTKLLGFAGTYWFITGLFVITVLWSPVLFSRYGAVTDPRVAQANAGRRIDRAELRSLWRMVQSEPELRRACTIEFAGQSVNSFFSFFIVVIALRTLHLDEAHATQLLGFQGAAYMTALFFFGGLVARFGDAKASRVAFCLVSLSLLALGLSQTPWILIAGCLGLGAGLGTLQIINLTCFALVGARLGRGKVSGLTPLVGTSGILLGSLLGGAVGQALGLQHVFLVYAPGFVAFALWSRAPKGEAYVAASEAPRVHA
jgi:MFS family permease